LRVEPSDLGVSLAPAAVETVCENAPSNWGRLVVLPR
jgi:hypothetical protein